MESKLLKTEIDYEEKYWNILEQYADLLVFLQEKAPLTHQAWTVKVLEKTL